MWVFFFFAAGLLALPVLWPSLDLIISSLFYQQGTGFFLADNGAFLAIHWLAYGGARLLAALFALLATVSLIKRKTLFLFDAKAWLFLFLALVIGSGLIANVGFKDHWGRARPREIVEFGGSQSFTPALSPHFENAHSNGSFVAGDAAFGFFFPALAFIGRPKVRKRIFWQALGVGSIFGVTRIAMGAHFLSDVIYAAFVMLITTTLIYALMYGWPETKLRWQEFFKPSDV